MVKVAVYINTLYQLSYILDIFSVEIHIII